MFFFIIAQGKKIVKFDNIKTSIILMFVIIDKKKNKILKSYKILGETLKYK